MSKYLLDTSVLIDYLRGRQSVVELTKKLANNGQELGVSSIVVAELYSGVGEKQRPFAEKLIDSMEYWETNIETAKLAGTYRYRYARQGIALTTADSLVAATAIKHDAILITANIKHYPMEDLGLLQQP